MMMLDGGKIVLTGSDNDDTWDYHCSGPNGELYDITMTDRDGDSVTQTSTTMYDGTDSSWYV
jgi:hypothetical protein